MQELNAIYFGDKMSSIRHTVNKRMIDAIWPTPRLIRAGRGLAGIDQATLAERANVSRQAVIAIEGDESKTMDFRRVAVLRKLQAVLENDFGIEFQKATKSAGPGVRLRNPKT
jgi:DNA-binding XRE family transcriptional regulator